MRLGSIWQWRRKSIVAVAGAAVAVVGVVALWLELTGPPGAFRNRAQLPACGTVEAMHQEPAGAAVDCFEQALRRGEGAELVVRYFTTEGDPIVEYYRTIPGTAGVEVFTDATEDRYGSRAWSHRRCPDARSLQAFGECQEL
jgi:hypothetical protein